MHAETQGSDGRYARVGSTDFNPLAVAINFELDAFVDQVGTAPLCAPVVIPEPVFANPHARCVPVRLLVRRTRPPPGRGPMSRRRRHLPPLDPTAPSTPGVSPRAAGARRAIEALEAQHARNRSAVEVMADRLTRWASSAAFLVGHLLWFGGWIAWNSAAGRREAFDPYPFGLLTMVVSLEAIFLTICVLMAQGREGDIAELREEVTLQVLLRSEAEVTKVLQLVVGLYADGDRVCERDADLRAMLEPLDAREIEEELTRQITAARRGPRVPSGER